MPLRHDRCSLSKRLSDGRKPLGEGWSQIFLLYYDLGGMVMAIKDFGKGLKSSLNDAIDTVKTKAKEVELPDIKGVGEKTSERLKSIFKKADEDKPSSNESAASTQNITSISARSAIKIIYFLMAADGEIYHGEEEKFDLIGMELDSDFSNVKEQIIQKCQAALGKVIDPEDYYDALQDGAEEALLSSQKTEGAAISPKHLVWNLLSIAYSDGKYDDAERRFLKYIVRKLNIDKAVFLEMESSILTLMDIERELTWIKTTNRPYLTIESMVNELSDRKNVISESILDLIAL